MKLITFAFLILTFLLTENALIADSPPKFWIKNFEGKRFNSKKQNTPFVVSFFFVNCMPCIKEIPLLYKFMSEDYPNVPLLFIDPIKQDSKKKIKKFAKKLKVPLSYFYKDSFGSISKKFFKKKIAFPTIVGIKEGKYIFKYKGIDDKTIIEIKSLL